MTVVSDGCNGQRGAQPWQSGIPEMAAEIAVIQAELAASRDRIDKLLRRIEAMESTRRAKVLDMRSVLDRKVA